MAKTITLDRVGPLSSIVPELSRQSGVTIELSPGVSSHTLILHIHDKPLAEVINRICWVTFSKSVAKGNGFELERDANAARAAKRAYQGKLVAWFKSSVDQMAHEFLSVDFDTSGAMSLVEQLKNERNGVQNANPDASLRKRQHLEPGMRAGVALLASIPPESLLSDQPGYRTYALYPRGAEAAIPAFSQIFTRYVHDRKIVASAEGNPNETIVVKQALFGLPLLSSPEIWDGMLHGFDQKGDLLEQAEILSWELKPFVEPPKDLLDAVVTDTAVALSETSKGLLRAWQSLDDETWRSRLCDPAKNDPQSALMDDVWRTYSRTSNRDVILDLPDSWLVRVPTQTGVMPALPEAIKALWPTRSEVEDGWLLGGPPVEEPGWGWQVPRTLLARLLRDLADPALDRLDVAADFLGRAHLSRLPLEYSMYLELAGVGEARPIFDTDPAFMAFYGSLSPDLRRRWRIGESPRVAPGSSGSLLLRDWAINQGVDRLDTQGHPIELSLLERRGCESIIAPPPNALLSVMGSPKDKLQAKYAYRGRTTKMAELVPAFNYYLDPKNRPGEMLVRPAVSKECSFSALMPGGWRVQARVNYGLLPKGPFVPFEQLPKSIMDTIRNAPRDTDGG